MNILFVISEVEDLAKTGGLADVGKALPLALTEMGHDVRIVMPYYASVAEQHPPQEVSSPQSLNAGHTQYDFTVATLHLESVPVYAIDYEPYFGRKGLYSDGYHPYPDNAERFAFFADAALHAAKTMQFIPDVVHCNDWHTALVPYFLRHHHGDYFEQSKSLLTIHNGAFHGTHKFSDIPYLQTHQHLSEQLDGDALNYLRIGIRYADKINAVSPTYATELVTPLGSHNLYNDLHQRRHDVSGILNGCDYGQWDPKTDPHLVQNYDQQNLVGKQACKRALQQEAGLPQIDDIPLVGMVCRVTDQKGFGYIVPMLESLLQHNVQLLIIGTGDPAICEALRISAEQHPEKFVFLNDFNVKRAHMLEAGADFFLMPSLFEPCGLNQMYSLSYGTLPIVRAVGGLKDTVIDLASMPELATGFMFERPDSSALLHCIRRALLFYHEYPDKFTEVVQRAMGTRFTWQAAALDYQHLYQITTEQG